MVRLTELPFCDDDEDFFSVLLRNRLRAEHAVHQV